LVEYVVGKPLGAAEIVIILLTIALLLLCWKSAPLLAAQWTSYSKERWAHQLRVKRLEMEREDRNREEQSRRDEARRQDARELRDHYRERQALEAQLRQEETQREFDWAWRSGSQPPKRPRGRRAEDSHIIPNRFVS
jgi:Ni/Co efflux regulator RcnB